MKNKLCLLMIVGLLLATNFLQAQGTAFTYQGHLKDGADPANGSYDLRFRIWDAFSAGSSVSYTVTNGPTLVSNGLFTVNLDFGLVFDGNARWIEIGVRTNGGGAFFTLTPRQTLTAAPYAIFAGGVNAAGISGTITNINATNITFQRYTEPVAGDYFFLKTTNAEPARLGFSSTVHGTERGVLMLGAGVGDVVLDPGYVNGRGLQIGNSGNAGAYLYIQYGMYPTAIYTNGFSHPLEFRSLSYFAGSVRWHYPGILSMPHFGNTSEQGELVFYSRVPHWNYNNKLQTAPNVNGTETMRVGTNGIVAASGIQFKGNGNSMTNIRPNIGSNSAAVSPNTTIYLTNQDGTVYRLSAQKVFP
jgi:hypothetical protein